MVEFMGTTESRMNTIEVVQRNQEASIRNLEKQIRQLVKIIFERTLGTLPSNIEINLREHVHAISTNKEILKKEGIIMEEDCLASKHKRIHYHKT